MSLIEQALRRSQGSVIPKVEAPPRTAGQSQQEDAPRAHAWPLTSPRAVSDTAPTARPRHGLNVVAITIMSVAALSVVGGVVWRRRTLSGHAPRTLQATQRTGGPLQVSPPSAAQRDLVLSGVVEGLGEPYAVINGMILGLGDQIDNATLVEVGSGMVKLRRADGSDAILRVPR